MLNFGKLLLNSILQLNGANKKKFLPFVSPIFAILASSIPAPASAVNFEGGNATLRCINIPNLQTTAKWTVNVDEPYPPLVSFQGLISFSIAFETVDTVSVGQSLYTFTRQIGGVAATTKTKGGATSALFTGSGTGISTNSAGSYVLPPFQVTCGALFPDVAFVFDTTGSMSNHIGAVQSTAKTLLNQLESLNLDYRVAVTDYKDFPNQGGYPYNPDLPFSNDKSAIVSAIDSMSGKVSGGGDFAESAYSALIRTIRGEGIGGWREDATKSIILLTDAPAHNPEPYTGYTEQDVINAALSVDPDFSTPATLMRAASARMLSLENEKISVTSNTSSENPFRIYSIIAGGDPTAVNSFANISKQTGGKLYRTSSADDIANALLDIITNISEDYDSPPRSVPEGSSVVALMVMGGFGCLLLVAKRKKFGVLEKN
ncbi:MAG: VWA domain-containing protein [Chlorogloeopsis fritschii C42_A2020_084]|uniref:vWA domain-containing protein n=1 Tax=Chlorogloeopsis fritschii TaxID=1124 RepID=UPI0019DADEEA|nr:vWA domain-containing protein [Chlorogloeopsis fritschii]MBF2007650.1 VWA domain-containing protein [Chlorogloeopsis fritschii C42_A2020_084]